MFASRSKCSNTGLVLAHATMQHHCFRVPRSESSRHAGISWLWSGSRCGAVLRLIRRHCDLVFSVCLFASQLDVLHVKGAPEDEATLTRYRSMNARFASCSKKDPRPFMAMLYSCQTDSKCCTVTPRSFSKVNSGTVGSFARRIGLVEDARSRDYCILASLPPSMRIDVRNSSLV